MTTRLKLIGLAWLLLLGNLLMFPLSNAEAAQMNDTRQPIQEVCQRKSIWRWNSFSPANPSQNEGKLGYVKLNRQTPCPPRGAVPVNQGRGFASLFHLSTPGSLLVMAATAPTMSNVTSDIKASTPSRLCFWMANVQCSCTLNTFISRQILTKVLRINSVLLRKAQNSQPQQTPLNTGF